MACGGRQAVAPPCHVLWCVVGMEMYVAAWKNGGHVEHMQAEVQ